MLWIGAVHFVGLACIALLMIPALKDSPMKPDRRNDDGDDGWGRGPKPPPTPPARPSGGLPLPDAEPSAIRLRDHDRLGDRLPRRERRPAREPAPAPARRPDRVPVRTRR